MRVVVWFVILFCLSGVTASFGEELTDEKKAAIKELLQTTGALQIGEMLGNAYSQQMFKILQESEPDIDPKAFDIIKEESAQLIHEEMEVKDSFMPYMYPIYHKYLTLEETKGLVQFYKTPLGQKAISVLPQMTREGLAAGQEWGQGIRVKFQERVLERLKKEGIGPVKDGQ